MDGSGNTLRRRGAANGPVRVVVADDHEEVRSALRLLLEEERDVRVVAEARNVSELLEALDHHAGCLVLLDLELESRRGVDLLSLVRDHPPVRVVALSGRPESRRPALLAGADAFVSKGEPPERVLAAVWSAAAGVRAPSDTGARPE